MIRSIFLVLVLATSGACKLIPDLSGFCFTFSGEGCPSSGGNGNQITYIYRAVTIGRGGILAPDTLTTSVITATQLPVIEWVNKDSRAHRLVSDTQQFDSGNINPDAKNNVVLTLPGTYTYHCAIHPSMVGLIIVP
jgi:hypothetical protein